MTNLAALSLSAIKPKKAVAQQILRELAEKHPDSAHELAELYTYFMPPKPKKARTVWEWVTLAMAVQDVRDYLNYVHVTADWLTASDGHRLHRAPNTDGLEPGYYLANGDKAHDLSAMTYPEVERVIPKSEGAKTIWLEAEPTDVVEAGAAGWAVRLPEYAKSRGLSLAYLRNALALDAYPQVLQWQPGSGNDAVRFDLDGGRLAVVMPMRL